MLVSDTTQVFQLLGDSAQLPVSTEATSPT